MRFWTTAVGIAASSLAFAAHAGGSLSEDACKAPPGQVAGLIEPGWQLLRLDDLGPDDQQLWATYRPHTCPGYAVARMGAGSEPSYAVALIQKGPAGTREKVVLLVPQGTRSVTHVLAKPLFVGNPAVVWRAGPGRYHAWDGGPSIGVPHDAVVVETLEASAELHYLVGDRLKSIVTSN
jgi:hypothetical protein